MLNKKYLYIGGLIVTNIIISILSLTLQEHNIKKQATMIDVLQKQVTENKKSMHEYLEKKFYEDNKLLQMNYQMSSSRKNAQAEQAKILSSELNDGIQL